MLELPGQYELRNEMIYFAGLEKRNKPTHQKLTFTEEKIRDLFTDGQQQKLRNPEFKAVEWSGEDFERHQGTRVNTPMGTAVYRRIYQENERIDGLEGTLIYQPKPGLTMPPLEIDL